METLYDAEPVHSRNHRLKFGEEAATPRHLIACRQTQVPSLAMPVCESAMNRVISLRSALPGFFSAKACAVICNDAGDLNSSLIAFLIRRMRSASKPLRSSPMVLTTRSTDGLPSAIIKGSMSLVTLLVAPMNEYFPRRTNWMIPVMPLIVA